MTGIKQTLHKAGQSVWSEGKGNVYADIPQPVKYTRQRVNKVQ